MTTNDTLPRHLHHTQKKALEPLAAMWRAMDRHIHWLDDEDLARLIKAAENVSEINCGWDTYGAAKASLPLMQSEQRQRAHLAGAVRVPENTE